MAVLDMPRPWLAQLLQLCCPIEHLALLCTCTSLRDLVLLHARGVRLQLSFHGNPIVPSSSSAQEHSTEHSSCVQEVQTGLRMQPVRGCAPQLHSLVLALREVHSPLQLTWTTSNPAASAATDGAATSNPASSAATKGAATSNPAAGAATAERQAACTTAASQHGGTESLDWAISLMRAALQQPRTHVHNVTHMTLHDMLLPSLVPAALVELLPQLQHLTLSHCTLQYRSDSFPAAPYHSHLTVLTLDNVVWDAETPPQKQQGEDLQQLTARMSASMLPSLPQLSAIHITNGGWEGWLQFSSCFGQQLKQLSSTSFVSVYAALNLHTLFPHVQQLELPDLQVHDERMDVLLKLPHLKHLYIDCFIVMEDYTETEGCDWDVVRIRHIDVASCARLPMQKWSRLEVCGAKPEVWLVDSGEDAAEDLALTATAMQHISLLGSTRAMQTTAAGDSNLYVTQQQGTQAGQQQADRCPRQVPQASGGIRWSQEIQWLEIVAEDEDPATEEPAPPSDLILATLPLFNTYQHDCVRLRGVWPVTQALLAALGKWTGIHKLGLVDCTWEADSLFDSLLVTLPHVQLLQLGWTETRFGVQLWQLKQLLSTGPRQVHVQLRAVPNTSGGKGLFQPPVMITPAFWCVQATAGFEAYRSHLLQVEAQQWQDQVQGMLAKSGLSHLVTVECCVCENP